MNKNVALSILELELDKFCSRSWEELRKLIDHEPETPEIKGPDGVDYQIEIQCFWDDKPEGDIRITGSIDDGGLRAFMPLTRGKIIKSNDPVQPTSLRSATDR